MSSGTQEALKIKKFHEMGFNRENRKCKSRDNRIGVWCVCVGGWCV